jgi:glucokinase
VAGIQLPDENKLPPGCLRDLVTALHALYRGAGRPGLRKISAAIAEGDYRDTVSHEKVSAMLNGKGLPRWSKLEPVVRQLAVWHVPSRNPDSEAARFLAMWEAAYPAGALMSDTTESGPQIAPASPLANTQNGDPDDQSKPLAAEPLPELSNNRTSFDHDVFLLFAAANLDVTQRIRRELESAGYRVWWDDGQLIKNGSLNELTNTIKTCRYLVVLLSAAFAESPYSQEYLTQEVVDIIESAGVSIVPALYEMSPIPPELGPKEFADFITSPNTGRSQLLTILRSIEGKVPKRSPGPTLHEAVSELIAMVTDAPELYVAVDLGGTKAYISVMTRGADRLFDRKFTTKNHGDASALLGFLLTSIEEAIAGLHKTTGINLQEIKEHKITAYGIAFAGPTDAVPGVVRDASNFSIKDFPLADNLRRLLHKPVFVENDANLGVLGEAWKGVARRHQSVIGIVVGTGIGGGIVVNRQLWRGSNSAAGEIGHLLMDPKSNVKCGCGQKGCFEALASRKAIAEELSRRKLRSDPDDVRWELKNLGSAELADYYADGDRDAVDVVAEAAKWWGKAVRDLLNILNPDIVFFGGGFMRQLGDRVGEAFLQPVKDEAGKCMNSVYALAGKEIPIVLGELENPMLVGACLLALRRSRGGDVTIDIIGSIRNSLSEDEANVLRSIYNYEPRQTRISRDPVSDFHEDRLRRLRNIGLIETVDNLSFKHAESVKITALGRAVAEDITAYRE